ncbi:MAG: hypothetical protein NTW19_24360 [Planctomycetota bacterium]|nr:hypothetical protein [Planctomycetota bacterium]
MLRDAITFASASLPAESPLVFVLGGLVIVGALVFVVRQHSQWSRRRVTAWAEGEGLELLAASRHWTAMGPFGMKVGKWNTVFRVRVRDADGQERQGWVCVCGQPTPWHGEVKVEWDTAW